MERRVVHYAETMLDCSDYLEKHRAAIVSLKTCEIYGTSDHIAKLGMQIEEFVSKRIAEVKDIAKMNTPEAIKKALKRVKVYITLSPELADLHRTLEQRLSDVQERIEQEERDSEREIYKIIEAEEKRRYIIVCLIGTILIIAGIVLFFGVIIFGIRNCDMKPSSDLQAIFFGVSPLIGITLVVAGIKILDVRDG